MIASPIRPRYATANATTCLPCAENGVSARGEASLSCAACDAGFAPSVDHSKCEICEPGFAAAPGAPACTACQLGHAAAKGSASCQDCRRVQGHRVSDGGDRCEACDAGTCVEGLAATIWQTLLVVGLVALVCFASRSLA